LIKGSLYDPSGVSDLTLNGRRFAITRGVEVPFATRLIIEDSELELTATDNLANVTVAQISLNSFQSDTPPRVMLACTDCDPSSAWIAGIFGKSDTHAPEISLKGWTDSQTVFLEKIYLEGQVRDENKIVDLSLNEKPILHRPGNLIIFNQFVELSEGQNTLKIKAKDDNGNSAEKLISVVRRTPKALQLGERLSLTVLPFEQKGAFSEASDSFQDFLINAMVNQNRFRVVERNKLDAILEEQKLSRTKLIDEKTALQLGKLIASQTIVAGSIIQTRTGMEIIARMIDTETSAILASVDVYDEATNVRLLNALSEGLAIKFHREFPLLEGLVVDKKGKSIFTDLGQDAIKIQRRLIVYRDTPIKHPVTGKILGSDNEILGRGRVIQVMPQLSKAEILDDPTNAIKPMDKVITE
jgi:TolB-like protein